MGTNYLLDPLLNIKQYNDLVEALKTDIDSLAVFGLSDTQKAQMISAIRTHRTLSCLVITYNEEQSEKIYEDLKFFLKDKVYYFPAKEVLFYNIEAHNPDIIAQRIKVIENVIIKKDVVVIASIEALMPGLIPPEVFKKNSMKLEVGDVIDFEEITRFFVFAGYERSPIVETKGHFSIRGGIIDFFSHTSDTPYRIEMFDNEVDSIRSFDSSNQRSIEKYTQVSITPVKEIMFDEVSLKKAIKLLKEELQGSIAKLQAINKNQAAYHLESNIKHRIEKMETIKYHEGLDNLLPFFYDKNHSILDYFNSDTIIFLDESARARQRAETFVFEFRETFVSMMEKGEVLSKQADLLIEFDELLVSIKKYKVINLSTLPKSDMEIPPKQVYHFITKSMHSFHGNIPLLVEELIQWKSKKYRLILLSGTESRGLKLAELLKENELECEYIKEDDIDLLPGQIIVKKGWINKGFEHPEAGMVIISDREVFVVQKKKALLERKRKRKTFEVFTELNVGDFVVHDIHGIGKYLGIEQLKVQDTKKDYIHIKYAGSDKLYIPTDQMDLIQKYVGSEDRTPRLSKLGGNEWLRAKNKVTTAIKEMAEELLSLYAHRSLDEGYRFSIDTEWQKQFEDLFIYEETQDQLQAIQEVKQDMVSSKVMDRLLCGDVGYGKTEVAIRAAFKAIMDEKQVAILVPTTILAQQHYNTFKERFSNYPFKVEVISRFKTLSQQKEIIKELRQGSVDIIIGTHRLLQSDIKFKDIGLLVIDEEQRFGVGHKEKIKKIRKNVDVLTMTATPIPRTLHMSLAGVRDISVIDNPPEERYPVQTYVVEYNEFLIRDAIMREMSRKGQVFFVYNRVASIDGFASKLKKLVPEALIGIAHGQMREKNLENIMIDFLNKRFDVLLCTTIIENGLDIQNVNTIIIYDSDNFGLSQLYQLRGRVGRTNKVAYAYFTYRKNKILTEISEKRLNAIKEFTEFGSGFKIAMRDLEIRGAGNILGSEQHGHMAAVGYDMYCKLLEYTVKELKGEVVKKDKETSIKMNINAYISDKYIGDNKQKIEIYKKISSIENAMDRNEVEEEIEDRFGDLPEHVSNLIYISYIKSLAQKVSVESIIHEKDSVTINLRSETGIPVEILSTVIIKYQGVLSFSAANPPYFVLKTKGWSPTKLLNFLVKFMEEINGLHKGQISIIIDYEKIQK